jgi:hypothetical protein
MTYTLLAEVTGIVETPVRRTADLLLTVNPGPVNGKNAWLFQHPATDANLQGGPNRFTYSADGAAATIELNTADETIVYQGGWWYRGEYTLHAHPKGTRIVHRVYNAATRWRWAVPPANRFFAGFAASTRSRFADTMAMISTELGCPTYLDDA